MRAVLWVEPVLARARGHNVHADRQRGEQVILFLFFINVNPLHTHTHTVEKSLWNKKQKPHHKPITSDFGFLADR